MRSKRAPQVINLTERRTEAAQLRRAGLTLQQIATRLGVSKRTIITDLDAVLTSLHAVASGHLDAWRSAQLVELQEIRERAWSILRSDVRASKTHGLLMVILRAQEREAKLLGLDAPAGIGPAFPVGMPTMTDEEARKILDELPPR